MEERQAEAEYELDGAEPVEEPRELTLTSSVAIELPDLNSSNFPITEPISSSLKRCIFQVCKLHCVIFICGILPLLFLTLVALGFGAGYGGRPVSDLSFVLANGSFMTLFYGLMVSVYSFSKMKFLIPYVIVCAVFLMILQELVPQIGLGGLYGIIVFGVLTQALWTNIKCRFRKMFYFWSQAPLYLAFIFFLVNDAAIIRLYKNGDLIARLAVTIIIYPIVFKILVVFATYSGQKLPETLTPQMYTLFALCCRVYFARFFNTQLRKLYLVFITCLILSGIRLTTKLVLLYQPTKNTRCFKWLCKIPAEREKDVLNAEKAQEIIGILFACLSDILYRATQHPLDSSHVVQTIEIMVIQYAVEIILQIIFVKIELKNQIHLSFKLRDKFIPVLVYSNWVVVCFVASRIVLLNYSKIFNLL
eukprot:Phypoly_transcript_09523.p1 GENE.Phypoly_transcript_09523~~Phypoly_transcript_09523.p1  ORF type:complete len:419 (+),score=38.23 Phypoly_transcript_09523:85-1341(+)